MLPPAQLYLVWISLQRLLQFLSELKSTILNFFYLFSEKKYLYIDGTGSLDST